MISFFLFASCILVTTAFLYPNIGFASCGVRVSTHWHKKCDATKFRSKELLPIFSSHLAMTHFAGENDENPVECAQSKVLVEHPTVLRKGNVLSFVRNGHIQFGNYNCHAHSQSSVSISVLDQSGKSVVIDVAQVISVWEDDSVSRHEDNEDGEEENEDKNAGTISPTVPTTPAEWAAVTRDAVRLLGHLSEQKQSDLKPLWSRVLQQRSRGIPVDATDVAVYLFQQSKLRAWLDPYVVDMRQVRVQAVPLAQWYAAGLLLHSTTNTAASSAGGVGVGIGNGSYGGASMLFKRRPTRPLEVTVDESQEHSSVSSGGGTEVCGTSLSVLEGGYVPLSESVVSAAECALFKRFYDDSITLSSVEASSSSSNGVACSPGTETGTSTSVSTGGTGGSSTVQRILRQLELYALSPSSFSSSSSPSSPSSSSFSSPSSSSSSYSTSTSTSTDGRARLPHVSPSFKPRDIMAVLRCIGLSPSPAGARAALYQLGQVSTPHYQPKFSRRYMTPMASITTETVNVTSDPNRNNSSDESSSSNMAYVRNLTPWSEEVMHSAGVLKEDTVIRHAMLEAIRKENRCDTVWMI
jgi:hypothetical protein